MAQATTYNVAGIREDLTDFLTILVPEDTPKLSMLSKSSRPSGYYQEWQVDTLNNVSFGGVVEGSDVATFDNAAVSRARVGNYIQKFQRSWSVSDILEAVDVAGVASEVANAKAKKAREIKRDIEAAIGSDNDMQAGTNTVPYKMRGLGSWISNSAQSTNPVPAAFRTPSASIDATGTSSLTESTFNAVFQSIYEQNGGKRSYTLFAGPALKKAISNFQRVTGSSGTTKTYQVTQDAMDKEITLDVEIYDGDFHKVTVIPDLFNGLVDGGTTTDQSRARGYVIDPELVGFGYLIGLESRELPDQGGGRRGFLKAVGTLMVKNPLGLGKFAATS